MEALMSGMKVVICHNCGGFGYTQGPTIALCGGDDRAGASGDGGARPENDVPETLVYECGACSGIGYLTI
jgi:hypothetical protein